MLIVQVAIGLFVLTLNVCSAQIWSTTCKKISPIKYEDILLAEDPEVSSRCHMVIWSFGHVVMWSCGHVVMWSWGHGVMGSCFMINNYSFI